MQTAVRIALIPTTSLIPNKAEAACGAFCAAGCICAGAINKKFLKINKRS